MARNYAALPHDYLIELAGLSKEEFGTLIWALLEYSAEGKPIKLEGVAGLFAGRVMLQEDRFQANYAEAAQKRSEKAQHAAEARWGKNAPSIPSNAQNANTNTEAETNTKRNTNTYLPRSKDRRKKAGLPADMERSLKEDMEWLEKFSREHAGEFGGDENGN